MNETNLADLSFLQSIVVVVSNGWLVLAGFGLFIVIAIIFIYLWLRFQDEI